MTLHALRRRAVHIVASRCRCGITVADDHVADAVFVMVYGIRRVPQLRIAATSTLAYLCGVARNEWRWSRWRRAREADAEAERLRFVIQEHDVGCRLDRDGLAAAIRSMGDSVTRCRRPR